MWNRAHIYAPMTQLDRTCWPYAVSIPVKNCSPQCATWNDAAQSACIDKCLTRAPMAKHAYRLHIWPKSCRTTPRVLSRMNQMQNAQELVNMLTAEQKQVSYTMHSFRDLMVTGVRGIRYIYTWMQLSHTFLQSNHIPIQALEARSDPSSFTSLNSSCQFLPCESWSL